ncbi:MAG: hypothetical protein JNM90_07490 [Burkholderiales bacterium]|nr:hypothetical protein [Burkholderiales bacterium]
MHASIFPHLRRLAGAVLMGIAASAAAQATRIVVPGPPGGFADITVRLIGERLQKDLGTPVVIEHKPGAGGTVGLDYLRNQRADGLTLGMINLSAAANESIVRRKSFALMSDFESIGQYAWLANILIVHPAQPGASLGAFIAALKARANTNYSSGGVGSPAHLASELFRSRTGVALTHVPYKGAPPAVTAVVAGEVAFMFGTASAAIAQVRGERVRALAVTTSERLRQIPDVPTLAEAGLSDFNITDWVGLVAPRGTPFETRERVHRAFAAAFADPAIRERLREATILPAAAPLGPADFNVFLRAEIDKWAKVVREANISQD